MTRKQTHLRHVLFQLEQGPSYGLFSPREDKDLAVVFVHGLKGDPLDTWSQFQVYADHPLPPDLNDWWQMADMYFYGYNSLKGSISDQSTSFLRFLEAVFPRPNSALLVQSPQLSADLREKLGPLIFSSEALPPLPIEYRRLMLVGHSLGAVLIRE